MSLFRRSVTSLTWNVLASPISIGVLFLRTVLLARLLPVDTFGVYTFAGSIVVLTSMLPSFGMGDAFLHRVKETEDEGQAAAIHFTLKLIFTLVWGALLIAGALLFTQGDNQVALIALTVAFVGQELAQTPGLILTRRVIHRRLAMLQVLNAILTTVIAVALAYSGVTLWALLATDYVTMILQLGLMYVWRPVWKPKLAWYSDAIRYFLSFGSRSLLASLLLRALDQVDDLWTGVFLGKTSLGFYSRAYTFATYPRRILATPVNQVTRGTYAELKGERQKLSRAFFRTNALLVRTGFLFAGILTLIAPEFIRLLLGEKWLPMLDAFRLMLVYTLFDPLKLTISYIFSAVGFPEQVVQVRFVQLLVLVAGLFVLGPLFDIAGVALAVDLMLVTGIGLLLWRVRKYVDFSIRSLFLAPAIALLLGLAAGRGILEFSGFCQSDWCTGGLKFGAYILVYAATMFLLERQQVYELLNIALTFLPERWRSRLALKNRTDQSSHE